MLKSPLKSDTWSSANAPSLLVIVTRIGTSILGRGQREKTAQCFHVLFLMSKGGNRYLFLNVNSAVILSSMNPKTPFPYSQAC